MLLVDERRWLRMGVAVAFCRETQQKRGDYKTNHAFFFRSENKPMSQFLPTPTIEEFQSLTASREDGLGPTDNCL
jgi:hypothetical protein